MKRANISTLKNQLSDYLRYVRNGGVVRVYDRNEPVAEIVPLGVRAASQGDRIGANVDRKVREGGIRPPRRKLESSQLRRPLVRCEGSVVADLIAERREGR